MGSNLRNEDVRENINKSSFCIFMEACSLQCGNGGCLIELAQQLAVIMIGGEGGRRGGKEGGGVMMTREEGKREFEYQECLGRYNFVKELLVVGAGFCS